MGAVANSLSLHDRYIAHLALPHPARPQSPMASAKVRSGLSQGLLLAHETAAGWTDLRQTWLTTPDRIWVWSDLHLHHGNILRYAGRPMDSLHRMHAVLVEGAQARVAEDDWLVFLGDLSLGDECGTAQWLTHCPGRKALLLGNHDIDRQKLTRWPRVWDHFEALGSIEAWSLPSHQKVLWLSHYPWLRSALPEGVINVHGHIHQHQLPGPYLNVSVEQQGMSPERLKNRLDLLLGVPSC